MIQSRLHATAQTDLSLYVAYTHAPLPLWLVAVSRFSGSVLTWRFQITSHLKNQGKAMSMKEIINIFSHNWVIQSCRVEAPWTRFRAGYCWRGEKRAGWTTSHSVRIRLFVSARGARPLVRHGENTAEAFHSKNERPFANGRKSAKNQRYQQRCCFA